MNLRETVLRDRFGAGIGLVACQVVPSHVHDVLPVVRDAVRCGEDLFRRDQNTAAGVESARAL